MNYLNCPYCYRVIESDKITQYPNCHIHHFDLKLDECVWHSTNQTHHIFRNNAKPWKGCGCPACERLNWPSVEQN